MANVNTKISIEGDVGFGVFWNKNTLTITFASEDGDVVSVTTNTDVADVLKLAKALQDSVASEIPF